MNELETRLLAIFEEASIVTWQIFHQRTVVRAEPPADDPQRRCWVQRDEIVGHVYFCDGSMDRVIWDLEENDWVSDEHQTMM